MSGDFVDDPALSMFMIYGKEDSGTTSLALSILDVIPKDKKVYTLLTEMPHNFSGPYKRHYRADYDKHRVVLPIAINADGKNVPRPISSFKDFMMWRQGLIRVNADQSYDLKAEDCGALIVDALDTLRNIFKARHDRLSPNAGSLNYVPADNDIIDQLFLPFSLQGIPIVVILKHKQDTTWHNDPENPNKLLKVEKHMNKDGSPKMVPTIDGDKVMRWGTIRLWTMDEVGTYEVMKSKGAVDEGERLTFGFKDKAKKIRTGTWLKELIKKMSDDTPAVKTVNTMKM